MSDALRFETPENVQVQYVTAGLGTRFLAWFIDQIFVGLLVLATAIFLACAGVSLGGVLQDVFDPESMTPEELVGFFVGFFVLVSGLGSFVYFTAAELLMRGQTPGKRISQIRVVNLHGFALDPGSILIRNLFRVVDGIPLMWIVPILSRRSQRTGDMAAGTVVISDVPPVLSEVRVQLAERQAVESEFRFDARSLARLRAPDVAAVERLLERWPRVAAAQGEELLEKLVVPLAARMQVELPPEDRRLRFLEDLLAAELRRQNRSLL